MRRILCILVALVFVASFAAAQTPPKAKATTTQAAAKPVSHQLTGAVTKADAASVSIKPTKGVEMTFVINADTKIKQGTKAMTAADIKMGDKIVVHYIKTGDTSTATTITLPPAPKPAPVAKTPAPKK